MITALDFEYAGQASANYGLRIADFDGSIRKTNTIGPRIKILETKVKHRPSPYFLGTEIDSTLSFPITMVYVDDNSGDFMHKQEIARIAKWLLHHEHKTLKIIDDEYGGVSYDCILSDMKRVDVGNYPFAIEVTATCADPWGIVTRKIKKNVSGSTTFKVKNLSSVNAPIFPKMKIVAATSGDIEVENVTTGVKSVFTNLVAGETATIDFDTRVILGDRNLYPSFNFKWFYFSTANYDTITITGNAQIEIEVEYPFIA